MTVIKGATVKVKRVFAVIDHIAATVIAERLGLRREQKRSLPAFSETLNALIKQLTG